MSRRVPVLYSTTVTAKVSFAAPCHFATDTLTTNEVGSIPRSKVIDSYDGSPSCLKNHHDPVTCIIRLRLGKLQALHSLSIT